ncbi:MAG: hypothetical protein ACM35H_15280 [Bacteroidota bacterium]|nr:hypothetical protein [Kiloniellaceae bacterium]
MIRKKTPDGGKLLLASVVAIGVAAVPATFDAGFGLQSNAATAQTGSQQDTGAQGNTGSTGDGFAEERAEDRADGVTMESEESVYEILGTTRQQAEAADTHTSATAQYGPLKAYQAEVERGNLDAAAENLAAVAERPITEEMVTDVNTELGIETTLTAKQIAEVAAKKQEDNDS